MDQIEHLERDLDSTVERVQRLVDEGHVRNVRLTKMEDALSAMARIETKVDDGFKQMNGRVRKAETAIAVLQWAVGLVGIAAGMLWGIALKRIFG